VTHPHPVHRVVNPQNTVRVAPMSASADADEAAESATATAVSDSGGGGRGGTGGGNVGLNNRMNLDAGLVRTIIRDVVGRSGGDARRV
jgi:hypothetical protein